MVSACKPAMTPDKQPVPSPQPAAEPRAACCMPAPLSDDQVGQGDGCGEPRLALDDAASHQLRAIKGAKDAELQGLGCEVGSQPTQQLRYEVRGASRRQRFAGFGWVWCRPSAAPPPELSVSKTASAALPVERSAIDAISCAEVGGKMMMSGRGRSPGPHRRVCVAPEEGNARSVSESGLEHFQDFCREGI